MNKWVKIGLLVVAVIFMARMDICGGTPDVNPVQNLSYTVLADGSGVILTWDAPADQTPDGYTVYVDGTPTDVATTTYTVTSPAALIEVTAYIGSDESNEQSLDFSAVESPSVTIWSINDPSSDHPSGFGFALSGTATAYSVAQQPTEIDYWLYQDNNGTLISPSDHTPPYNSELNVISQSSLGTFDNVLIVPGSGSYISQQALAQNEVRGLWFEGDDSGEYFAKMLVSSLTNSSGVIQANLRLACQTAADLRWVVN